MLNELSFIKTYTRSYVDTAVFTVGGFYYIGNLSNRRSAVYVCIECKDVKVTLLRLYHITGNWSSIDDDTLIITKKNSDVINSCKIYEIIPQIQFDPLQMKMYVKAESDLLFI